MKRYVIPTIKLLIALIIAVALVRVAFFPSDQASSDTDPAPGFTKDAPTTTVSKGSISNSVDVSGQVVEDAAVDAKATAGGTIDSLSVAEETTVNEGEPIAVIKSVEQQAGSQGGSPGGSATTEKVTWNTVYAPVSGKVKYQVIANQEVSVGTVVAAVSPTTYSATGTMTPAQQYRLSSTPAEATVTVNGGPAPFACTNLSIGTKKTTSSGSAGSGSGDSGSSGGSGSGSGDSGSTGTAVEVRCSIPPEQQVFPGLKVTIGIDGGSAQDTLVVPVTAVEGSIGTGHVWVLKDPKNPTSATRTEVTLGLTDGTSMQITGGIEEGTQILQYVPGKDVVRTGTPNTCEPDNTVCYDSEGKEQK